MTGPHADHKLSRWGNDLYIMKKYLFYTGFPSHPLPEQVSLLWTNRIRESYFPETVNPILQSRLWFSP